MEILAEISDKTLGLSEFEILGKNYELKKTARAILKNNDGLIGVQHLVNDSVHKLPGGGVEEGETIEEALHRELREEVGCTATVDREIGITIEYREKHKLIQIGYCYEVTLIEFVGEPTLEEDERISGLTMLWTTPEDAMTRMRADVPNTYQGAFITKRELAFIEAYLKK
jgi:8-oxo-dGTP diphosphatase